MAYTVFARLRPGKSPENAQAALRTVRPHLLEAIAPENALPERQDRFLSRRIEVEPGGTGLSFLRSRFSRPLQVLEAFAGLILLLTSLNLANLFLAKAARQRQQSSLQVALGATWWDVARPRLVESLLLSAAGAGCGVAVARWAARFMIETAWTGFVKTPLEALLDLRVLVFTVVVSLATGVVFGIAPSLYAAGNPPIEALRQSSSAKRVSVGGTGRVLVVAQISLSFLLIVAAALFASTLHLLRSRDAGYRRDHLLTFVLFPQPGVSFPKSLVPYYQQLEERVRQLPGVTAISYSEGGPANQFESLESVSAPGRQSSAEAIRETIAPGFFSVAQMRFLAGRDFRWSDLGQATPVAIISQSVASKLFGKDSAVGRTIWVGPQAIRRSLTVVGVVNSASLWKSESVHPKAAYSLLYQAGPDNEPMLDVRVTGDPGRAKPAIERVIHSLGYHDSIRSMTADERLESYITVQRLSAHVSTFFGILAVLIAALGVYGLTAFNVAARTRELGIRSALGARRVELILPLLLESMLLAAVGECGGVGLGLALARGIRGMVFGISPTDPVLLLSSGALLVSVALLAALVPS